MVGNLLHHVQEKLTLIFFSNYPEEAYNCMTLKIIMTINFGLVFVKLHIPLFSMEKNYIENKRE